MQSSSVRALAFHHEKGYEAQRELALRFAGVDGRIATMEDIVYARMHSLTDAYVWNRTFITGSRVYHGCYQGKPMLAVTHGGGPEPIRDADLKMFSGKQYDHMRTQWKDHDVVVEQEVFDALVEGKLGDRILVDLSTYRNPSVRTEHKASNRYTYAEVKQDPVIKAVLGKDADAFIDRLYDRMKDWLKAKSADVWAANPLFINFMFIYEEHQGRYSAPNRYARVYPLTMEGCGFTTDYETKEPIFVGESLSVKTNSGIDDLGGPAYYVVGIRGKEPVVEVVPEFRTVTAKVKELWSKFVQPLAEVPHDPYVGIRPDGSRERPYYILNRWHTKPEATGRIQDDGTESTVPEYRIKKAVPIEAPRSVTFKKGPHGVREGFPYPGMWEALKAAMPKGANAIACGSSCHSGGNIEADVSYWHIEVDEEPFRILMKCGDDFFSQYNDQKRPTSQPHLLMGQVVELDRKLGWRIPDDVLDATFGGRNGWPVSAHLIGHAPPGANAMWVEKESVGYQEKAGKNVMHVSVHYYKVRLADRAFRPFTELRGDFDWILERRAQAGLLKAA